MIDTFWLTVSSFVQAASVAIATGMHLRLAHCQKVEFRFLGVFLIYSLINEIAGQILAHLVHANGNLINNIYSILEGPILLLLYKRHVAGVRFRNVVWLLITALIAFGVIEMFWIHGPMKINTIMKVLNSVTMMFVTIFYFYVLMRETSTKTVSMLPMFWVNTGLMVYFAGAFISYIAADYVINHIHEENYATWIATWTIHNYVGSFSYLLLGWAMLVAKRAASKAVEGSL